MLAARCWPRDGAQRALSLWAEQVQPLSSALSYRISARVRTGPRSLRSGLRPALAGVVRQDRPRWRPSGDGVLEILLSEWRAGELVTGLRLGGNRGDPAAPVPPAVAAAMVTLAGPPVGVLLDPSCGDGADPDRGGGRRLGRGRHGAATLPWPPGALPRRARCAPGRRQEILEPDGALGACVTRLPAGTGPAELAAALAEMSRVTRARRRGRSAGRGRAAHGLAAGPAAAQAGARAAGRPAGRRSGCTGGYGVSRLLSRALAACAPIVK